MMCLDSVTSHFTHFPMSGWGGGGINRVFSVMRFVILFYVSMTVCECVWSIDWPDLRQIVTLMNDTKL